MKAIGRKLCKLSTVSRVWITFLNFLNPLSFSKRRLKYLEKPSVALINISRKYIERDLIIVVIYPNLNTPFTNESVRTISNIYKVISNISGRKTIGID